MHNQIQMKDLRPCASKSRVKISVFISFALLPYSAELVLYVTNYQLFCQLQEDVPIENFILSSD